MLTTGVLEKKQIPVNPADHEALQMLCRTVDFYECVCVDLPTILTIVFATLLDYPIDFWLTVKQNKALYVQL